MRPVQALELPDRPEKVGFLSWAHNLWPVTKVLISGYLVLLAASGFTVAETGDSGSGNLTENERSEERRTEVPSNRSGVATELDGRQQQRRRRRIPVRMVLPGERKVPQASTERAEQEDDSSLDGSLTEVEDTDNPASGREQHLLLVPDGELRDLDVRADSDANPGDLEIDGGSEDAIVIGEDGTAAIEAFDLAMEGERATATPAIVAPVPEEGSPVGVNDSPYHAARALLEPIPGGKRMAATRTTTPPVLDGRVEEPVWQPTDAVSDFLQREPQEGGTPSERTAALILYDDHNLYFGFILYDSDPSGIIGAQLRRDSLGGRSRSDDTISVVLDTFHDHRNAFLFTVNPLGTKYDATIRGETQVNGDWDERWEAAAQITERGWEAELSIPWAILRYSGNSDLWGIDFRREIRRKNEEVIWSNYRRNYEFRAVSQAGHLEGLQNLKLTERFRLKPYFSGGYDALTQRELPLSEGTADFGIEDFKIKINSNLTSQLTYNTDFAQVEVDEQRVNLTRFSLFFPEKREFFLEAANNFSFGPPRGRGEGMFGAPLVRLYHSRNIGLTDNGNPLPITFGAKLTGKIGGGNLGFLNVQTGHSEFGEGQNYTAVRWRRDVLERSSIGAVLTNVQGPGGAFNRVLGVDTNLNFFENLNVSAFAAQSRDDEVEGGSWIGQFRASWDSDLWEGVADVMRVDSNFRSDLGFILRDDIVRQLYRASYKPRPGLPWMRQIAFTASYQYFTDSTGRPIEREQSGDVWVRFESNDNLIVSYQRKFERLDFDFPIHPSVTIPVGDYNYDQVFAGFFSNRARRLSGRLFVFAGGFYDGTTFSLNPQATVRFSEKFSLRPGLSQDWVDLPSGSFSTSIVRARADVSFSDRWLTDTLLQYNSLSDQFSVFARLRYIYRIGDDFYLVYRQTRLFDGTYSGLDDRSMTAKMTYSFAW